MTNPKQAERTMPLTPSMARSRGGVGYSDGTESRQAGADAARAAVAGLGGERVDAVMVFATSRHDPRLVHEGVRSVVGPNAQLFGGWAFGGFTNDRLGYDGFQVVVGVLSSNTMRLDLFAEGGLDTRGERAVGKALGRRIADRTYVGEPNLLLLYDSVKRQGALNVATYLLEGLEESLGAFPRHTAGIGLFGDLQLRPTFQWLGDDTMQQTAMAAVFSGGVRMDTMIMHGCTPSGRYHTVTKAEGTAVLEIDGRRAIDLLGEIIPDRTWEEYPLFLTLGVNKGDKFGEFREEDYANRLCMAVDKERGALIMFEPNLVVGTEIQLMRHSVNLDYVSRRVNDLFDGLGDRRPFFALYINCAGRCSAISNTEREDAEEVQKAMNARNLPLLGLYSGVEIAPVAGSVQALDWTGIVCVFSE
jgi:hypothetical protein